MNKLIPKSDWIQRALANFLPARKLLAGAGLAVLIATGVWAFSRSGSSSSSGDRAGSEMEPVLDQAFSEADLARIVKHLDAKGIDHKVEEGKVFVAASQRPDVLSDLFYVGILGGSGKASGFDALVKQMTAWDPPSKTDKMFNRYREEKVEEVITRYPGVRKTTVVIDPANERRLGGESIVPTAMVDIQTRGGGTANPRQLSQASVNVLTGVIANLSRDRVRVTIDGATFNSGSDEQPAGSGSSGDFVERKQKSEQLHVAKVRQLLSYIPGDVIVSVSVDLDVPMADGADDTDKSAKPQAETVGDVVANAVPVIPNVSKSTTPTRVETVRSASVAVPRTYFVKVYRRANSGTQEPTDVLLQPVVDAYSLKVRNLVKNALGLEDDAVTVEQYDDALPAAVEAAVAASASIEPSGAATAGTALPPAAVITRNLNPYAREIALVTLGAVVVTALWLLVSSRYPRRAAVMVDAHGRQHVAGEHEVINGTLDDVIDESDHDEARDHGGDPHQLFRRVRDMAQEHPDDAARVLRSWIYQQD